MYLAMPPWLLWIIGSIYFRGRTHATHEEAIEEQLSSILKSLWKHKRPQRAEPILLALLPFSARYKEDLSKMNDARGITTTNFRLSHSSRKTTMVHRRRHYKTEQKVPRAGKMA